MATTVVSVTGAEQSWVDSGRSNNEADANAANPPPRGDYFGFTVISIQPLDVLYREGIREAEPQAVQACLEAFIKCMTQ